MWIDMKHAIISRCCEMYEKKKSQSTKNTVLSMFPCCMCFPKGQGRRAVRGVSI